MNYLAMIIATLFLAIGCNSNSTTETRSNHDANRSAKRLTAEVFSIERNHRTERDRWKRGRQIDNSLIIGLDADMSSGSAMSGKAIKRGIELAVDKINADGGLLGRPIELVVRDHRGNPDRGVDNILEFSTIPDVLAVVGGIHTPVALQQLKTIHEERVIYLGPWAAGTPIVENGFYPNYVFRVSVRDEHAGGFLVKRALSRKLTKIGLLLERTGWGRSNQKAMVSALSNQGLEPATIEWFHWGESDFSSQFKNLEDANADSILLVANPLEGIAFVKQMAKRPEAQRLPIISHWGISAGDFFAQTREILPQVDVTFLQTFSFVRPKFPERSQRIFEAYKKRYADCKDPRDILSPVGTAHAYEIVSMLAAAVTNAGSSDSAKVRDALENLRSFSGIIRDYERPFRPDHHDALTDDDFTLARFADDGAILPVREVQLAN